MACSSSLSQSSFPCSALSVVSSMMEDEVESLGGVMDASEDVVQSFAHEHTRLPKAQQSNYFTSQLNSPSIFAVEKRESHVSSDAGTPLGSFNRTASSAREKCIRPSPIASNCGRERLNSTDGSPYSGHLNLRKLWAELGIPADEQDAVLAYFSKEKQNTGEYDHYIDKLAELANHRRLYISITFLHERLTAELVSSLCNMKADSDSSTETKNPDKVLILLGLYRLLVMALMALTEMARSICTIPICLPYLNARDVRSTNSIKRLLDARLLSPERLHVLLSINSQPIDLASIEEFFLRCEARHGACIAEHALLIACIPASLMDIVDASLANIFAQYFHLVTSTADTMVGEMEELLKPWTRRLNLSGVNINVLTSLSSQFQLEHYVLMAMKEERLISDLEMRLDEMQLRAPNSILFTVPIYGDINHHATTAECSSSVSDAPSAPLLAHSSVLRDSI